MLLQWHGFIHQVMATVFVSTVHLGYGCYHDFDSTNIARLIGFNAVQVLATLFLLSYAKLLRTVIAIASFTTLSVENGDVRNVWLLDGNVAYMSGPHVALFVAGMLATIFYILPFTALVALGPFLQARSGYISSCVGSNN